MISEATFRIRRHPWFPHKVSGTLRGLYRDPSQIRFLPDWLLAWRNRNPVSAQVPWISFEAREAIERYLVSMEGRATVFEYGSGGSTLWYAHLSAKVICVEHDLAWYERMESEIRRSGIESCEISLKSPEEGMPRSVPMTNGQVTYGSSHPGDYETYVRAIDRFADKSFDLVAIDGRSRAACLVHAAPKVRPGGFLYLDDSERPEYALALSAFCRWERVELGGLRPLDFPNYGVFLRRPESDDGSLNFGPPPSTTR
jgi:hypothetical protein